MQVSGPQLSISIYPFEGGQYTISGTNAGVLQAQINTSLKGGTGTFSLALAPGGPNGVNARPYWTELLTPMSLVIIGLSRGSYNQTPMIAVVTSCTEQTKWDISGGTSRYISVLGKDFGIFFERPTYYTTTFLGGIVLADPTLAGSLPSTLGDSLFAGPPDAFGKAWYQNIMAGPNSIMDALQFSYKNSEVKFYDLVQQFWQPYGGNVQIPGCDFYMLSDGTWYDKFHQIFPFPYYEFFVTTAPSTFYASGSAVTPASQSVGITGFTQGVPQIVARKNPLPRLSPQADGTLQIDTSLWDSLTPFFMNLEELSGIEQSISFDSAEVRNFYLLNPTNMLALFGVSNGNNSPWVFSYAGLADAASIHRYGYLPQISELHWWADPTGSQAQNAYENGISPTDWNNLVEILNYQQASYFEPTPLMAKGSITFRLRPDIFIGSKFLFSPWKQQDTWEFYVEGVSHNYVFGGQSTTTLQLSRGLPSSVYQNSNLLTAIHQGNAQRINGTYTKGIPSSLGNYLQPVNFQTAKSVLSDVAQLFNAPQYRNQ